MKHTAPINSRSIALLAFLILAFSAVQGQPSATLYLEVTPASETIQSGNTLSLTSQAFLASETDTVEAGTAYTQAIRWMVLAESHNWTISDSTGETTDFAAHTAYMIYTVVASLVNPEDITDTATDSAKISVVPSAQYVLIIEATPSAGTVSPYAPAPLDTVSFTGTEASHAVYAVVRDISGNYVSMAQQVSWHSLDPSTAEVTLGAANIGEGIVTKTASSGATTIVAQQSGLIPDSVSIKIGGYSYTSIRIMSSEHIPIDSLFMGIDADTTLYVQAMRSDNAEWESTSVKWTASSGLSFDISPPDSAQSWQIIPAEAGGGWIRANLIDDELIADTLLVEFQVPTAANPTISQELTVWNFRGQVLHAPPEAAVLRFSIFDLCGRLCMSGFHSNTDRKISGRGWKQKLPNMMILQARFVDSQGNVIDCQTSKIMMID